MTKQKADTGGQNLVTRWMSTVGHFLTREVWSVDLTTLPKWRAVNFRIARIVFLAVRGLSKNDCFNRASALTYITVLSLVPMLALAFSVAKGFGAYDHLVEHTVYPWVERTFGDVGVLPPPPPASPAVEGEAGASVEQGVEAAEDESTSALKNAIEKVLASVDNANFSNVGLLGLVFVLFTAVKLLTSIENVFNRIWGVQQARSLIRKVTDYIALVVISPILVITATAVMGVAQSNRIVDFLSEDLHLGPVLTIAFRLIPYVALWVAFGFLYMVMPNTRVSPVSALVGGILGGSLWHLFQILHVEFQIGVARANAIYAGFAAFPIFLVWIYFSWVTVLLGAQLAWAHQYEPEYRKQMRDTPDTGEERERLAVRSIAEVARAFATGGPVLTTTTLAARFAVAPSAVAEALAPLVDHGLLARTEADSAETAAWIPARDLEQITVQRVLDAVRGHEDEPSDGNDVLGLLAGLRRDAERSDHNLSMRDVVERMPGAPA